MKSFASLGSLPLLVADLADDASRDFLIAVATADQVAYVPLLAAPVDRSTHALEVYSPGSPEPLHLFAEPVGPPTSAGFPLQLSMHRQASAVLPRAEKRRPTTLRARRETAHELTSRHTADLVGGVPLVSSSSNLLGRGIAGGKLEIESLIGGGGVGAVFRARHRELQMAVAVKVLHDTFQADADFGRRFHAEALAASRLDHPNVTRVLDFGQEPDGLLYLVMEYLDGTGLRALLDQERRLGTERIVRLMSQVCAGLAHAHARSIVHKDVKPENLVILQGSDDDGNAMEIVKVCDFGIAQSVRTDAGAVADEPRRFQGTPEYMSPEQCLSETLDARSDVYAVGIVMYELATGDVPFTDSDVGRIVHMHMREPVPPPSERAPEIDSRLERIILRALEKSPDARFASMRDLRAALRDLLEKPPKLSGQHAAQARWAPELGAVPGSRPPASGQSVATPPPPAWSRPPPSGQGVATPPPPAWSRPPPSGQGVATPPPPAWSRPPPASHGEGMQGWVIPDSETTSGIELDTPKSTPPQSELVTDPSAFMRRLVSTSDPRAFAELVSPLDATIRELAQAQQAETLWRLASTLDILATEGPERPGSRAAISKMLLRVLRDPTTLAPIAQRVLATEDTTAARLLTAAGAFGAHALYSARVRQGDAAARARFTAALRLIGPPAMPILRGGLERLADRLAAPGAVQIAEDLIVSIPRVYDEPLGALVVAYARCDYPSLACAAVLLLPVVWGERSRSLVLGLLDHPNEDVAIAALGALNELGVADEHTSRRVAGLLDRSKRRTMRLAAVRTIAHARGEARRVSAHLLEERLRRCIFLATSDDAEVALGLAHGLLALASDLPAATRAIDEATRGWPTDVRMRATQVT